MPPRRRRKKTDACRPALDFRESPLHIVHKIVSPVFSADHPLTADVVPLDSDTSIPWVSPQFRGPMSPSKLRNRRQRNPSKGQHATRSRNHSTPGGNHTPGHTHAQYMNRYKSLQFFGDQTKSATSPVEELSINTQEEVCNRGNSSRSFSTAKGKTVSLSSGATVKPGPSTSTRAGSSREDTPGHENTFHGCGNRVRDLFSDDSTASDSAMPKRKVTHTCAKKRKTKAQRGLRKWDGDKNSSVEQLLSDSPVQHDAHSASPPCVRRSHLGTQHRPRPDRATHTTKRLFSESKLEAQEMINAGCDNRSFVKKDDICNDTRSCDPSAGLGRRRSLRHVAITSTPQQSIGSAPASPLDIHTPTLSCRTPEANKHHCAGPEYMYAPLLTPTQHCLPSDCKVLVYDTPEEDYGLPVRLRRRRCTINKMRIT